MTNINEKILSDSGLTQDQAKIYLFLLENGMANAKSISLKTGLGRALTYKVIDQLIASNLVEKRDVGKIARFFPSHPQAIKSMAETRKRESAAASESLNTVFGSLASSYNMLLGKPNIQFHEGVEGIERIYEDILETGQDIFLISSPIEEGREGVLHLIKEQIEKQVAKNIRTKAITPIGGQKTATEITEDEKNLITRKEIPAEKLHIPAQIIIYGDKVSITNFKEGMISVIIESKYIHETFKKMFEYIWSH